MMELIKELFGELFRKSANPTVVSRFLAVNGVIYLIAGVFLLLWPGSMQTVFGDSAFVGREQGLIRVLGLTITIIGILYFLGGRANSVQIIAVSILSRPVLVPAAIVPIALFGVFPGLLLTFVALDMCLSIINFVLYRRVKKQT